MASSPTRRTPSRFPPPGLDAAHLSYGRRIATTSESGVVHHAPRGEPPPLRGAAGVLRRRADPRRGRRAVRLPVSYTHLRAHETKANLVCRLLLEKKKQ